MSGCSIHWASSPLPCPSLRISKIIQSRSLVDELKSTTSRVRIALPSSCGLICSTLTCILQPTPNSEFPLAFSVCTPLWFGWQKTAKWTWEGLESLPVLADLIQPWSLKLPKKAFVPTVSSCRSFLEPWASFLLFLFLHCTSFWFELVGGHGLLAFVLPPHSSMWPCLVSPPKGS